MSSFYLCPTCRAGVWSGDRHTCPPAWVVHCASWHGDELDDGDTVHARSASGAAEKWADEADSDGDYTIVGGNPATVRVKRLGADDDTARTFVVEGETVPSYWATEA